MKQLAAARAVISIWTENSVRSDWVRAEAGRAKADGKLIPVKTSDVAYGDIPLPFGEMHTENVGSTDLIRAAVVAQLAKPAVEPSAVALLTKGFKWELLTWWGIIGGALTLFTAISAVLKLSVLLSIGKSGRMRSGCGRSVGWEFICHRNGRQSYPFYCSGRCWPSAKRSNLKARSTPKSSQISIKVSHFSLAEWLCVWGLCLLYYFLMPALFLLGSATGQGIWRPDRHLYTFFSQRYSWLRFRYY